MANKKQDWAKVLGELKYPLVFFGLSLLVTESTYGAVLATQKFSEDVEMVFGSEMGLIFLVTIGLVGFLTFFVPKHLMLLPQSDDAEKLKEATKTVLTIVTDPQADQAATMSMLSNVRRILLREDEGQS